MENVSFQRPGKPPVREPWRSKRLRRAHQLTRVNRTGQDWCTTDTLLAPSIQLLTQLKFSAVEKRFSLNTPTENKRDAASLPRGGRGPGLPKAGSGGRAVGEPDTSPVPGDRPPPASSSGSTRSASCTAAFAPRVGGQNSLVHPERATGGTVRGCAGRPRPQQRPREVPPFPRLRSRSAALSVLPATPPILQASAAALALAKRWGAPSAGPAPCESHRVCVCGAKTGLQNLVSLHRFLVTAAARQPERGESLPVQVTPGSYLF